MLVESNATCLEGDELPVALRGPLTYTTTECTIPGTGTLDLTLTAGNKTTRSECEGKKILTKGGDFVARFNVSVPAKIPGTPPIDDPQLVKNGTAKFSMSSGTVKAG
jgi:hypothetical protein